MRGETKREHNPKWAIETLGWALAKYDPILQPSCEIAIFTRIR